MYRQTKKSGDRVKKPSEEANEEDHDWNRYPDKRGNRKSGPIQRPNPRHNQISDRNLHNEHDRWNGPRDRFAVDHKRDRFAEFSRQPMYSRERDHPRQNKR